MSGYRSVVIAVPRAMREPLAPSAFPEHAFEDGVDVLEVIAEVELLGYLGVAEILLHLSVLFQQRLKVAFSPPNRHRVALHELVGVLAAGAFLRQRHQN